MSTTLPAVWMRGGTSKGLFFRRQDLPADRARWDNLFLAALGSPDPFGNQLDGLGGATAATSKVAVVGPSSREDCDVDFHVARVGISEGLIDVSESCSNLAAAVGPFAIHSGLLRGQGDEMTVRVWQENVGRRVDVRVPLSGGQVRESGHCHIDGVRGSGAAIQVDHLLPGGGDGGLVLPTARPCQILVGASGKRYDASLVDAGSPTLFVLAEAFRLQGSEGPEELATRAGLLTELESLRQAAVREAGMDSAGKRVAPLRIALLGPAQDYPTPRGNWVWAEGIDLTTRLFRQGKPALAYADGAALALAVAAQIPGTLVRQLAQPTGPSVAFGHASGLMRVSARVRETETGWVADSAGMQRTARRLMAGRVFLPEGLDDDLED